MSRSDEPSRRRNWRSPTILDHNQRPMALLDDRQIVREL